MQDAEQVKRKLFKYLGVCISYDKFIENIRIQFGLFKIKLRLVKFKLLPPTSN